MSKAFLQRLATLKPPRRSRKANILLALLLVGCSSSTIETFGCACAGWSVSQEQLAEWREKAPQGDVPALLGLKQYAGWKITETAEGTFSRRYWEAERALATQRLDEVGALPALWIKAERDIWNVGGSMVDDDPDSHVQANFRSMPRQERLAKYDVALDQLGIVIGRETEIVGQKLAQRPLPDWMDPRITDGVNAEGQSDLSADLQAYRQNRNALARRWGLPERRF